MNLSIDDLGRIVPWLRTQSDRALEVLLRTQEFFGSEGQFRQRLFIAARLMRVATDVVTSMQAGYYLWAFIILIDTLIYPLRGQLA